MVEDKDDFLISKIDKEKCINCGLCEKVCSIISNIDKVIEEPLLINSEMLRNLS